MGLAGARDGNVGGVTLEEVARMAGVSRATASRVVNESPRVRPDIRLAVEASAIAARPALLVLARQRDHAGDVARVRVRRVRPVVLVDERQPQHRAVERMGPPAVVGVGARAQQHHECDDATP